MSDGEKRLARDDVTAYRDSDVAGAAVAGSGT